MKKSILLFLLLFAGGILLHAATFNVNQDVVFTTNCNDMDEFNGQATTPIATVTVNVNHTINGGPLGDPNLENNVNQDCRRYMFFDVYKKNMFGQLTYETTVTKYDYWIKGATYPFGSSSTTYQLTGADLESAGVSSGTKEIKLRVRYDYFGNTPHVINAFIYENGNLALSQFNAEGDDFTVDMGTLRCMTFYPCTARLSPSGSVYLQFVSDGVNDYYIKRYEYHANVTGGSGSFTYMWSETTSGTVSSNSNIEFSLGLKQFPGLSLTVIDNVTGCVYTWTNKNDLEASPLATEAWTFSIAPNPVQALQPVHLAIFLPSADEATVQVYDLQGREITSLRTPLDLPAGDSNVELNGQLPAGTYLVRIRTAAHGHLSQRLLVRP